MKAKAEFFLNECRAFPPRSSPPIIRRLLTTSLSGSSSTLQTVARPCNLSHRPSPSLLPLASPLWSLTIMVIDQLLVNMVVYLFVLNFFCQSPRLLVLGIDAT